ncbi:MAG TPA: RtcB family protein [Phycisphaerae bacterium]|nr:RtcB family protein [Phycisphaerae bacterium]
MKPRELINLGFEEGPVIGAILKGCEAASAAGLSIEDVRDQVRRLREAPESFQTHPYFKEAADILCRPTVTRYDLRSAAAARHLFGIWGEHQIDTGAIDQMANAMRLPISVGGALMPDAHIGYGLPIGGVLATQGAVIPYAVGVDIACRMMLSVLPIEVKPGLPDPIDKSESELIRVIERNTRFGAGAEFKGSDLRDDPVMDEDWSITGVTQAMKPTARGQLGTSGGGNHFVDVGEIEFLTEFHGVPAGRYVAMLSHSGSRGPGARTCEYYSKLAMSLHPDLPPELKRLAWLDLDKPQGQEYWAAMELMGRFASANHHCIHATILRDMKLTPLLQVENHHNFAWKEMHGGREVIVHRKGATPAGKGAIGFIPGSMAAPGFLVEGKGEPSSFDSAAHGAGRQFSRKKAKETFRWNPVRKELTAKRVKMVSAGLDEVPGAYKPIEEVMEAQKDLVHIRARFEPRIVKMAADGFVED